MQDVPDDTRMPRSNAPSSALDSDVESLAADAEMAGMFVTQALERLGTVEATLGQFGSDPEDITPLSDLFMSFQDVQGSALVLGVTTVQELALAVETLLDRARAGRVTLSQADCDLVLRSADLLTTYLFEISNRLNGIKGDDPEERRLELVRAVRAVTNEGDPAIAPAAAASSTTTSAHIGVPRRGPHEVVISRSAERMDQEVVTVELKTVHHLMDLIGELTMLQSIVEQDLAPGRVIDERATHHLSELGRLIAELQRNSQSLRRATITRGGRAA